MENQCFYQALKASIGTALNYDEDKFLEDYVTKILEKFSVKNLDEYVSGADYKKLFMRIYLDMVERSSFNVDIDGKETNQQEAFTAELMEKQIRLLQQDHGISVSRYSNLDFLTYKKLLAEYDVL